jgi:predicted enzyme related to lactoylglutathione lyase
MAVGRFMFLTIDCARPDQLAPFWAELLGTEVDTEMDGGRYVFLKGGEALPVVCLQRVPEPKRGKARIHLDIQVDDLDAATARVMEMGGGWPTRQTLELDGFRWRTMTDPEGNEFDLAVG